MSKPQMKAGLIHLSQTQIHIPTKVDYVNLNQVRIVPKIDHYVVEVDRGRCSTPCRGYSRQTKDMRYLSMFFGTIEQPLGLKVAVTIGGLGLIGLELSILLPKP